MGITPETADYLSAMGRAFNWYNQEKDKKDARQYLKSYVGRDKSKFIDNVPDKLIICTYGWMARLKLNGCIFKETDNKKLDNYINDILKYKTAVVVKEVEVDRPSVRDYLEDKVKEYIGELEGTLDSVLFDKKEFSLLADMQARAIPAQYCPFISNWLKRKAGEYIDIYESKDSEVKEAYRFSKRTISTLIVNLKQWLDDIDKYTQFKKANRKPRVRKLKPAGVQVRQLKFMKESVELNIKSINPVEIVGASQVWVYNTKYKKLAVYRSDSKDGIQVKGTTLQNYDPSQCEQKTLRKPQDIIKKVMEGGKLVLRKLLGEINTKESPVNGRINDECIVLRAIK